MVGVCDRFVKSCDEVGLIGECGSVLVLEVVDVVYGERVDVIFLFE